MTYVVMTILHNIDVMNCHYIGIINFINLPMFISVSKTDLEGQFKFILKELSKEVGNISIKY